MVPQPSDADSDDAADGGATEPAESLTRSEVADALTAETDELVESVEASLTERSDLVAVGVPLSLLPPILDARDTATGDPWRIAVRPGVVDVLGRAFALGTAVSEAVATDEIELRAHAIGGSEHRPPRTLFATPDRVDAVAGPAGERTLVTERGGTAVAAAVATVTEGFEAAAPAAVAMPARSRLLSAARERLDDRFADDLASALHALEYGEVGRTGTVTDQTLLVALAARHDHLFYDLRAWAGTETDDGVGIAPGQELTADRRALVGRELIESIKVPMGAGRPNFRLRAVDDALLRAEPSEVLSVLCGRFSLPVDADGEFRQESARGSRRPVWDRQRRR